MTSVDSIDLEISGAQINITSEVPDPDLFQHVRADFGLYEMQNGHSRIAEPMGARIQVSLVLDEHKTLRDQIPSQALLCSAMPVQSFSWWQQETRNFELWGDEVLIISDRDASSHVFCRPGISIYPLVRAEIVRCLRSQLNHRHIVLFHAGLAQAPNGQGAVLVPGVKSQGKTSTVLWLVQSGLKLHSDEMVLCARKDDQYVGWGIPRRFALTKDAICKYFPQHCYALKKTPLVAPFNGEEKHLFHLRDVHPRVRPEPQVITMLVRPQLWRSSTSKIVPMSAQEVQADLYKSCEFNGLPPHQLEKLTGTMAAQIEGYRLMIGRDSTINYQTLRAHLVAHGLW